MDVSVISIVKERKAAGETAIQIFEYLRNQGFEVTWLEMQQVFQAV